MKMYILIKDCVPVDLAPLIAAHASLAGYLKFSDRKEVQEWVNPGPFYKAVCVVNEKEFQNAKAFDDYQAMTSSELGGKEVALVFCPRNEWPKPFKFYKLWKAQHVKGEDDAVESV